MKIETVVNPDTNTKMHLLETPESERLAIVDYGDEIRSWSKEYKSIFNRSNGHFVRWGQTIDNDPRWCPWGPEILDLEITKGRCPNACKFCYKGNGASNEATNMSLETFKQILDRMPPTLTQIAFGITGVQTNPDFIPMMREARSRGIAPNFTLTGKDLTAELADEIAPLIGACAVSVYEGDEETGFRAIEAFKSRGVEQVNVHLMLSVQTLAHVKNVFEMWKQGNKSLHKVNAFVLLGVKPKGRAAKNNFESLPVDKFAALVQDCFNAGIPIGFDSCSAPKFDAFVSNSDMDAEQKVRLLECSESCESTLFSSYINEEGVFYPCSFAENIKGIEGVPVLDYESFYDVWNHENAQKFRDILLSTCSESGCRHCPVYDIG